MTLGLKPLWKCTLWDKYLGKQSLKYTFFFYTKLWGDFYWYLEWLWWCLERMVFFWKGWGSLEDMFQKNAGLETANGNYLKIINIGMSSQGPNGSSASLEGTVWGSFEGWSSMTLIHCKILIFSQYDWKSTLALNSSHLVILRQLETVVPIWHCRRHSNFLCSISHYHTWSLLNKMRKNTLCCLLSLIVYETLEAFSKVFKGNGRNSSSLWSELDRFF